MGTIFEILVIGDDVHYAEQASWEAFNELDNLEQDLSRFIENSDVSRINNLRSEQPLTIGLATFECLKICKKMNEETGGAFEPTIGPLLDCWLSEDKTLRSPTGEELRLARHRTGMNLLQLNEEAHTVQLLTHSVHIDLGGIGKGYAVDEMANLLREWEIDTALIHGGSSSVFAIGAPPRYEGWPVTISDPENRRETLIHLQLRDSALGGSGLQKGYHVIDPRTAKPVEARPAAWASAPSAAISDALSTAFMIMSPDAIGRYCVDHPDVSAMIILEDGDEEAEEKRVVRYGLWDRMGYPSSERNQFHEYTKAAPGQR